MVKNRRGWDAPQIEGRLGDGRSSNYQHIKEE